MSAYRVPIYRFAYKIEIYVPAYKAKIYAEQTVACPGCDQQFDVDFWVAITETVNDSGPGRLVVRQPLVGIVNSDMIVVHKIGWQDYQIGPAGVTQRREQDTAEPGRDDHARELSRWRVFLIDAGDLAPGTIPFPPSAVPGIRVEPLR